MYENAYPLVSALSRPLIAKNWLKLLKTNSIGIAHGCTGKGMTKCVSKWQSKR